MAHVSVPATTSNLGSGFDCIGLAVDRHIEVDATVDPSGHNDIRITRHGTLASIDIPPEKDLLYIGFNAAATTGHRPFTGSVHFNATSTIPPARGLGSSAAALVAGAVLANEMLDLGLSLETLTDICSNIEGHPDNVAPAIYGGAILGVLRPGGSYKIASLTVHDSLAFIFASPDFSTETKRARGVLPPVIPYSRAVLAASRSAALVQGLATGDPTLLTIALDDVLHVPYRRSLINGYDEVTTAACNAGAYGATLSGSGSTLVAIAPTTVAQEVCSCMQAAWTALGVTCDTFISSRRPVSGAAITQTTQPV